MYFLTELFGGFISWLEKVFKRQKKGEDLDNTSDKQDEDVNNGWSDRRENID
jgi:hypothetical protein